jgi:hypothetical protein
MTAYTIQYEDRPDYLIARVAGPADSVAIKLAYFTEVTDACRERGLHKLLVVEALGTKLAPAEVQRVARELQPALKGLIIAFVDLEPEHHAINRLGEATAVDAGAVGRVFRDLKEAERWIAAVP